MSWITLPSSIQFFTTAAFMLHQRRQYQPLSYKSHFLSHFLSEYPCKSSRSAQIVLKMSSSFFQKDIDIKQVLNIIFRLNKARAASIYFVVFVFLFGNHIVGLLGWSTFWRSILIQEYISISIFMYLQLSLYIKNQVFLKNVRIKNHSIFKPARLRP